MEKDNQSVFIIDLYNEFSPDKVVDIFKVNGRWWAIKEVSLEWGLPKISSIEEDNLSIFQIYDTLEEAQQYMKTIKAIEGMKF